MAGMLEVLAFMQSESGAESLKKEAHTVNGYRLKSFPGGLGEAKRRLADGDVPDVLLLDVAAGDRSELGELKALIDRHTPNMAVVATAADADVDAVRTLMRIGVADFLPQPIVGAELLTALENVERRLKASGGLDSRRGRTYSFIKSCGGMGATTLAIQTACALARSKKDASKVALIDFDIQFGNIAVALDLDARRSLADALESFDRFDADFLDGIMAHHPSGIDVLPAPAEMLPLDSVTSEMSAKLIALARRAYDYVIVDHPHAWTHWSADILSESDLVLLVTQLSVPAIRQARRQLEILRRQEIEGDRVAVIANRYAKGWGAQVRIRQAEKALGRKIDHFVANDYKAASEALDRGVPLTEVGRRLKVVKQIDAMVEKQFRAPKAPAVRAEPVLA